MKTLRLAKGFDLPLEVVTQKLAWLGVTGSGKTYGASKLFELLWHRGAQVLVIDPVGVWYGVRLAKDGKKPSAITVPIFGGLHGDVPLEPMAGALMANLIVDKTLSAVLDVSQFESDTDKARFARDFADRFFFRKKSAPSAVHLFLEECQEFVPQNPQKGEERMLHAFIRLQKLGRNFGIGSSYLSQRPQEVNKKALNMAQTLFVFRTTGTHERGAIEKWIEDKALDEDIAGDLPKIATGHCHVWSPEFLKISETAHILEKETFNASATPEVGAAAVTRELAPIDLAKVRTEMAATIEKAKADDPRELRRQIAELKKQAANLNQAPAVKTKTVEKFVLKDGQLARLEKVADRVCQEADRFNQLGEHITELSERLGELAKDISAAVDLTITPPTHKPPTMNAAPRSPLARRVAPSFPSNWNGRPARQVSTADGLTKAEQRVLDAVAWWSAANIHEPTRLQVAMLARYTVNGHFNNLVGGLRTKAYVDYPNSGGIMLTDEGRKAANAPDGELTRAELIARVMTVLRTEPYQRIFGAVVDAERDLTREELAGLTNYTVNGHFNNMVASLRSLGVIDYPSKGGVTLSDMFEALSS